MSTFDELREIQSKINDNIREREALSNARYNEICRLRDGEFWSFNDIARSVGISVTSVARIYYTGWNAHSCNARRLL